MSERKTEVFYNVFARVVQPGCPLAGLGVVVTMLVVTSLCFGCVPRSVADSTVTTSAPSEGESEGWCFWLQEPDPHRVAELPVTVAVVDYSRNGRDDGALSPLDVAVISRSGKRVWSYLSIGEAESYRFYWNSVWNKKPPFFLGPENPDWPENFKVRYWREDWWDIAVRPYLDRILRAGFDGVYLDIIDGYWFWGERNRDIQGAADAMAELVCRIAAYCRVRTGEYFSICPQNGLAIIEDASPEWRERYLQAISAVGVESLFYNIYSEEDQSFRLKVLRTFVDKGKTVFNVEYIPSERVTDYRKKIRVAGIPVVPFRADPNRALDMVTSPLR